MTRHDEVTAFGAVLLAHAPGGHDSQEGAAPAGLAYPASIKNIVATVFPDDPINAHHEGVNFCGVVSHAYSE